jgi:hypothetical protein
LIDKHADGVWTEAFREYSLGETEDPIEAGMSGGFTGQNNFASGTPGPDNSGRPGMSGPPGGMSGSGSVGMSGSGRPGRGGMSGPPPGMGSGMSSGGSSSGGSSSSMSGPPPGMGSGMSGPPPGMGSGGSGSGGSGSSMSGPPAGMGSSGSGGSSAPSMFIQGGASASSGAIDDGESPRGQSNGPGGGRGPGLGGGPGRGNQPGSGGMGGNLGGGFGGPSQGSFAVYGPDMKLPSGVTPLAPCFSYIGADDASKLVKKAAHAGYDALIIFELEVKMHPILQKVVNDTRIRVVVPKENPKEVKGVYSSKKLNNLQILKNKGDSSEIDEVVESVVKKTQEILGLQVLPPALTADVIVNRRIPAIIADDDGSTIDRLSEINFYYSKGFIDEIAKGDAFEKIARSDGKDLVFGSKSEKAKAIEKLLNRELK